ncbi:hypothetical protein AYI70_g9870 [Smittium culicis]|uniref:Uncharacterized protein n=1 Tax=Smittium culicis TaxID=133412 RepID=A0A1R1X9B7_9FUNG|nr:hypothetical protein AYI70_g12087 [Smittium culicis]OMJ11216.1 hypothetical protein AYI70_g9870 [Smittium culicis]
MNNTSFQESSNTNLCQKNDPHLTEQGSLLDFKSSILKNLNNVKNSYSLLIPDLNYSCFDFLISNVNQNSLNNYIKACSFYSSIFCSFLDIIDLSNYTDISSSPHERYP